MGILANLLQVFKKIPIKIPIYERSNERSLMPLTRFWGWCSIKDGCFDRTRINNPAKEVESMSFGQLFGGRRRAVLRRTVAKCCGTELVKARAALVELHSPNPDDLVWWCVSCGRYEFV